MNFSCTQQELLTSIQTVQKNTHRTPSPFQQYIYIEANQYNIKLVSSSSESTVIATLDANISVEGRVLVPASIFRDIVSKMPPVLIDISTDENNLMTVKYINMKYSIQCITASSFSFLDNIDSQTNINISTQDFKRAISQTYFTASLQETRPILTGILVKAIDGAVDFVSTDGSRVSISTIYINEKVSFDIIVPARFIHDIISFSPDNTDSLVQLSFNDKYLKLTIENITVVTGLISGKFINYNSILPKDAGTVMMCNRSEFLNILERAFLLSDENLYTVKFDINYSKLYVSSNNTHGEAFEEIYVKTEGNPVTIAFNSKSFIEILKNMEYEQLVFEFTTGTRICKIKPLESDNLVYLISPIRI